MGCGASRTVQAIDDGQDKSPESPEQPQQPEELTSIRSNSPDLASKPVEAPTTAPVIRQNGTELSAPALEDQLPESTLQHASAHSGGRAVAFEVRPPDANNESLIRRHPPRKFQKLEDQQQNSIITQEQLEEKQAIAEKRRQEILSQRVQSAKHRTAAARLRGTDDGDEVEKDDGVIESAASVSSENEL
ncbi:uncharacterized protein LOC126982045 [Eriocheir sinensis]|uniref:uncharacterized protein LOC126982045 n=1 Tax=Eriocheir sinensis TaxID=95602 RepID=UPI0021C6269C|nr:uncharacterized protein LOC126982045 [Eriocheir sinensis]